MTNFDNILRSFHMKRICNIVFLTKIEHSQLSFFVLISFRDCVQDHGNGDNDEIEILVHINGITKICIVILALV